MKKLTALLLGIVVCSYAFARTAFKDTTRTTAKAAAPSCSIEDYKGKSYIFDGNFNVFECDAVGKNVSHQPTTVFIGSVFDVVAINNDNKPTCMLVIKFHIWKKTDTITAIKRATFNYKTTAGRDKRSINAEDNVRYFLLSKDDLTGSCSEYVNPKLATITFGTFTTPFKFRPTKSLWSNNLSLGTAVYINRKWTANSTYGLVVGISLSAVTLDSLSTNAYTKKNSDRPALTPSLSLVYAYKNINFIAGMGIDYINKTSPLEASWIFNGKPWIGFGIGINLFSTTTAPATTKTQDQK
ncbi:MAG: hypothetical protein V4553_22360 [Bacteroidota bacterium]